MKAKANPAMRDRNLICKRNLLVAAMFSMSQPYAHAAAAYPERPLRLVVPLAPGGTTDILARLVAQRLSATFGQPVIVDNRPGAGGNIGNEVVARSAADGYTLLMAAPPLVINPGLYSKVGYRPLDDYTPISLIASVPVVLAVNPSLQSTLGAGLKGKTLGVFGLGRIGSLIAGMGGAFGMQVLVWGRESSIEKARELGYAVASSKSALFQNADVLSLHVPLNEKTRGLVTLDDLLSMKTTALLVNTSRADLVATDALVQALQRGRPGYAAVDVYEEEPVLGARHPLLKMDNVLCTPHLGIAEETTYELYFGIAFDQVNAFAAGKPINVLNREALSGATG